MENLRRHYQLQLYGIDSELSKCPLCETSGEGCKDCPWIEETGETCIGTMKWDVVDLERGNPDIPKQTLTKWRKRRIKEITEWIGK